MVEQICLATDFDSDRRHNPVQRVDGISCVEKNGTAGLALCFSQQLVTNLGCKLGDWSAEGEVITAFQPRKPLCAVPKGELLDLFKEGTRPVRKPRNTDRMHALASERPERADGKNLGHVHEPYRSARLSSSRKHGAI